MIRDRTIIAIASSWDFDPTSKHHVMRLLSEHNHILWVNYHGSRKPSATAADLQAIAGKLARVARGVRRVAPNIDVLTPLVLPLPGSAAARRVNQAVVVGQIRRALRSLPPRAVQLWSFAPDVAYLLGRFDEELDLYYCVDEFSAFSDYDAAAIRALESELIAGCDVVLTTAADLQAARQPLHPRTHLVLHGVDFEHFASACADHTEVPAVLRSIPGPVFGFFGMIQDWVDLELIAAVASRRPRWSFVLIGHAAVPLAPVADLDNVHLLGRVPFADLPAFCKGFDAALIPFKINELTRHVNPIKLREYLAAGLPVVSTPLPEVLHYRPHVLVADGPTAFDAACRRALDQRGAGQRAARQAAVRHETWRHKVEHISDIVEGVLAGEGCVIPGS